MSKITDMSDLFAGITYFNGDVSDWDVSNVEDMFCMFKGCEKFNQDISNWDVSNVKIWVGCSADVNLLIKTYLIGTFQT